MSDLDKLRTILANERTVLAYIRTALAIIVFGMAAVKFFSDVPLLVFLGWISVGTGILGLIFSVFRFRKVSKSIKKE